VKHESENYLKLLERRLDLLGSLAKTAADSRESFIAMDLEGIERRIAEQEELCARIRSLDSDITKIQDRCAQQVGANQATTGLFWPGSGGNDEAQDKRIRAMLGRIQAAQSELQQLNDANQAMLRRSRRTVRALLNLYNSFAPTYAEPPVVPLGAVCEERA